MSRDQSVYAKNRRERLMAAGLCHRCAKNPPAPGRTRCEACRTIGRESTKRILRRKRPHWKALGLCPCCGTRLRCEGESRCAVCVEQQAESHRKHTEARRAWKNI